MKSFFQAVQDSGKDIYVPTKTTVLGIFDFRAFLNLAMLLAESDRARALRQMMLDIYTDVTEEMRNEALEVFEEYISK